MRRSAVAVAAVLLLAGTVGCTGKKSSSDSSSAAVGSATVINSPTATPSPTPAPVNDPAAAKALTALAAKAAAASYDATYEFDAGRIKGVLRIFATPPRYRVDIGIGPATAQYYRIDAGTVSCSLHVDQPTTCALVAGPGEKVPDVFDPGVQRLFTDGLDALANNPKGYAVEARADSSARPGVPTGKCFHIERLADLQTVSPGAVTDPGKGFETGEYCFDPASGVLTRVGVSTGSLTLTKPPAKPTSADFTPPATPQPLSPGGATASPS